MEEQSNSSFAFIVFMIWFVGFVAILVKLG